MEYIEFKEKLIAELERQYTEGSVKCNTELKLNGVKLDGIGLITDNEKISPVFYANNFYMETATDSDIEYLAKEMIKRRREEAYTADLVPEFNKEKFIVYDNIKDKVMPMLINTALNSELLERIPHREWLDLSIIYIVNYEGASIRIFNSHMDMWDVTEEDLYEQAMINLNSKEYRVYDMKEALIRGLNEKIEHGVELDETDRVLICAVITDTCDSERILVITNPEKCFGASVCLMEHGAIQEIAKEHDRNLLFTLISINEFIIFNSDDEDIEELKGLIKIGNESCIFPEHRLSDNLYFYDREKDEIRIV